MQVINNTTLNRVVPGTALEWSTATFSNDPAHAKYMPGAVVLLETDTRKVKITDGVTLSYSALPYVFDAALTPEIKALIDGAGLAGGVLVLNDSGIIGGQYIPAYIANGPTVVQTIADRDAIAVEERTNIVVVRNATADPTVGMSQENQATKLLLHFDNTTEDSSAYDVSPIHVYDNGGAAFTTNAKFGSHARHGNDTNVSIDAYKLTSEIPAQTAFCVETMYMRDSNTTTVGALEYLTALYSQSSDGTSRTFVARLGINTNTHNVILVPGTPSAAAIVDTVNINDGVYHRLAIRHTGSVISLYVDDRLVGSVAHSFTAPINVVTVGGVIQAGTGITSGTYTAYNTANNILRGSLDELRLINYDKFLSDTTIPTEAFSVNTNAASYVWDDTTWAKISEYESMDVDFSDFVMQGNTTDRLVDGTTYVQYTPAERTQLAQLRTNLIALTGTETANYNTITGRFDTVETRFNAVETRLDLAEASVTDLDAHVLLATDTIIFNSTPLNVFQ